MLYCVWIFTVHDTLFPRKYYLKACVICLHVSYHHSLFFGNHNSLFLLAHYVHYSTIHCILHSCSRQKNDVCWGLQQIYHSEKPCIGYSTRFSTKSFANGLGICFSHGMYQLGICGYRTVICHSDVTEIKK